MASNLDSGIASPETENPDEKFARFQQLCDQILPFDSTEDSRRPKRSEPKSILKEPLYNFQAKSSSLPGKKSVSFSPQNILHEIPHRPNFNPQSPRMPVRKSKRKASTASNIQVDIEPMAGRGHRRTSSYMSPNTIRNIQRDRNGDIIAYSKPRKSLTFTKREFEDRQTLLAEADALTKIKTNKLSSGNFEHWFIASILIYFVYLVYFA